MTTRSTGGRGIPTRAADPPDGCHGTIGTAPYHGVRHIPFLKEHLMGAIVGGIILFVLGAIARFALEIDMPGVDSAMLGTILMVAGAVLFLVGLLLMLRSRKTVVDTQNAPGHSVSERRDPPPNV